MLRTGLIVCLIGLSACAAKAPAAHAPQPPAEATADAPAALERSLFARTPQGTLSEDQLQQVLDRPLDLELPARVGVLPVIEAQDWRGPSPSYEMVSPGLSQFVDQLPADDGFSLVTEMTPIPSGALGIEALRETAARYKLRYLILYREHVAQTKRANGFAAGFLTGVGAVVLPGSTLAVDGYSEATLLDVKTGILLFTVRRRLEQQRRSTVWQRQRKLDEMREALAVGAAGALAKQTRTALAQLQEDLRPTPAATQPTAVAEVAEVEKVTERSVESAPDLAAADSAG